MKARRPSFTRECKLSTTNYQLIGGIAGMDKEEIEKKARARNHEFKEKAAEAFKAGRPPKLFRNRPVLSRTV